AGQAVADFGNAKIDEHDVVIGVAASGTTPYTVSALRAAAAAGALTIGIANNPDTPLLSSVQHSILVETGGELVAGSTRMKAGTAQKAILNMLSTAIMLRLDRIYKGQMVDMIVSNNKLEDRAARIVSDISGCAETVATRSLTAANRNIKQAVLIARGLSPADSQNVLRRAEGSLRRALSEIDNRKQL
ncbi:MAG: N-acetylmuramic acid 6-phosphate etherase, partial [Pseudomonadota bacterium]